MPTTADYLNDLIAQKEALVENLEAMGVSADISETFNTLVPKVSNIDRNLGIAKGLITFTENATSVTISNLPFAPKRIAISDVKNRAALQHVTTIDVMVNSSGSGVRGVVTFSNATQSFMSTYGLTSTAITLTENSITVTLSPAWETYFLSGCTYYWMVSDQEIGV